MHSYRPWMLIVALALLVAILAIFPPVQSGRAVSPALAPFGQNALQTDSLAMLDPLTCPSSGCAAGQHLKMRYEFLLANYDPTLPDLDKTPNVKICVYMPDTWTLQAGSIAIDAQGELNVVYSPGNCNEAAGWPLTGYKMVAARQASIKTNETIDSLGITFKIPTAAAGSSKRIKARVLVRNKTGWSILETSNSDAISVATAAGSPFYVAKDATGCGSSSPCFINSGIDDTGGIGTGLKDAIDAAQNETKIYILGTYSIKKNAVNINKSITVTSPSNTPGTITYTGTDCSQAMLSLSSNATISGLTINDGTCTTTNRTLLNITDTAGGTVIIESNTLTGGDNAIHVQDIAGAVQVRFNHISGNAGKPLLWENSTKPGSLSLVANNLNGNGGSIECANGSSTTIATRKINHNYFGSDAPPENLGHCALDPNKRLGAPIALKNGKPGVNASLVPVTDTRPAAAENPFDGKLSFLRSGTDSQDFDLYIVDHGYATEQGLPFTLSYGRSPGPCSNYYDVFLPDGVAEETPMQNTTLELFFRYDRTFDCTAAIGASNICLKTTPTPARVPLFWYDVAAVPTLSAWTTSLQSLGDVSGQVTTCDTTQKEIKVEIDTSGRPNLLEDMNFTPLMAGVPIISTFQPLAYDKQVRVNWSTYLEPDVKEFYIMRGDSPANLSVIAGPFTSLGSAVFGSSYNNTDSDMTNGKTYYYRLKIVREDGNSVFSEVYPIAPNVPTTVPTRTVTPTFTRTPIQPTRTLTRTLVPTHAPTRAPTSTFPGTTNRTRTPTITSVVLVLPTITGTLWTSTPIPFLTTTPGLPPTTTLTPEPSATFAPEGSATTTLTATLPPRQGTGTAIAMLRSLTPAATRRPTRTATLPFTQVAGLEEERPTWLSLLLGLLAGAAFCGAVATVWYYMRRPH